MKEVQESPDFTLMEHDCASLAAAAAAAKMMQGVSSAMMYWARLRRDIGIPFTTDGFLLNELLVQSTKPCKRYFGGLGGVWKMTQPRPSA